MDPGLGFAHLLGIAQGNQKDKSSNNVKLLKTKFGGAKKEVREKGKLSANVQKFLEKKEQEEKQKKIEEKMKLNQLNELRSERAKNKIAKHLKVTKSANKAVLNDAVDKVDTAVTLNGRKQCDEDDYGYESKASSSFYEKLMSKYEADPEDPMAKFSRSQPKERKDLQGAKDRVRQALRKEEENPMIPGKKRRRTKEQIAIDEGRERGTSQESSSRDSDKFRTKMEEYRGEEKKKSSKSSKDKMEEEARRRRLQNNAKKAPPTMDFNSLLKIADKKKAAPIKIDKKGPAIKDSEFGDRPMSKQEKEEYIRENKSRLRREGKLPPAPEKRSSAALDLSDSRKDEKASKFSSSYGGEPAKQKVPRSEPGPQFHSVVKKSMPPPEKKNGASSELEREKREIEAKMKELERKKDDMERKHKVLEENEKRRVEFQRREEEKRKKEMREKIWEKQEKRRVDSEKRELDDMSAKYKEMQRQMKEMEDKLKRGSSGSSGAKRDPSRVESRSFPGEKSYTSSKSSKGGGYSRRIESDSEEEYDSEMDDFIDDTNDKTDISAEIRNIFGYDKRRYKDEDFDDRSMENNKFSSIMMEEARSARIGRQEDLEDMKREEMENKRKKMKNRR